MKILLKLPAGLLTPDVVGVAWPRVPGVSRVTDQNPSMPRPLTRA